MPKGLKNPKYERYRKEGRKEKNKERRRLKRERGLEKARRKKLEA